VKEKGPSVNSDVGESSVDQIRFQPQCLLSAVWQR